MQIRHRIALLGATTAAAAVSATALAASAGAVTVRVEGKAKTLAPSTPAHLHSGWITKGGAKKGLCSARSAAGALDSATHHRWSGTFYSSFSDYLVSAILGEKYGKTAKSYWEFFVNGVSASTGVCAYRPHGGDQILFAVMPVVDSHDYTLVITGAPRSAKAGHAFKVKIDYVNAAGKKVALSGARLAGTDFLATTTGADGAATITPTKAGTLKLGAQHAATKRGGHQYGYVRAASVTVHVS